MRIVLDPGALARAVGERDLPIAPSELMEQVVLVLDASPYLLPSVAPLVLAEDVFSFGFEATNLAAGQGVNVDGRIARRLRLRRIDYSLAMGISAAPAAAGLMQFLGVWYLVRQATPTLGAGAASPISNAATDNPDLDALTMRTNAPGPPTVNLQSETRDQFGAVNLKSWVQTNGTGGQVGQAGLVVVPELVLEAGDFLGFHVDVTGPAGITFPTEVHATLQYTRL